MSGVSTVISTSCDPPPLGMALEKSNTGLVCGLPDCTPLSSTPVVCVTSLTVIVTPSFEYCATYVCPGAFCVEGLGVKRMRKLLRTVTFILITEFPLALSGT